MVRDYVEKRIEGARLSRHRGAQRGPRRSTILREPEEIHLLFTDVVMPGGMFGPELARQASRLRPDLKILFTSGYSDASALDDEGDPEQALPATAIWRRCCVGTELRQRCRVSVRSHGS